MKVAIFQFDHTKEMFLYPIEQLGRVCESVVRATGATITYLEKTYSDVVNEPEKLAVWQDAEKLQFETRREALRGLEFYWYHRHMNQNAYPGRIYENNFGYPVFNLNAMVQGFVNSVNKFSHGAVCGRVTGSTMGAYISADINRTYFMLSAMLARVLNGDPEHMGFAVETSVNSAEGNIALSIVREPYSVPEQFRGVLCPYVGTGGQKSDDILLDIFCSCFHARLVKNTINNEPAIRLIFPIDTPTQEDPPLYSLDAPEKTTLDDAMGTVGTMLTGIMPGALLFGHF